MNSARKWDSVEINAQRRCQNSWPTICFTASVKLTRHDLTGRTALMRTSNSKFDFSYCTQFSFSSYQKIMHILLYRIVLYFIMATWWAFNKNVSFKFYRLVQKLKKKRKNGFEKEIQLAFSHKKGLNYYDVNLLKCTGYVIHQ